MLRARPGPPTTASQDAAPTPEYETMLWGLATILLGPLAFGVGVKLVTTVLGRLHRFDDIQLEVGAFFSVLSFLPTLRSVRRKRAATFEPRWSVAVGLVIGGGMTLLLVTFGLFFSWFHPTH